MNLIFYFHLSKIQRKFFIGCLGFIFLSAAYLPRYFSAIKAYETKKQLMVTQKANYLEQKKIIATMPEIASKTQTLKKYISQINFTDQLTKIAHQSHLKNFQLTPSTHHVKLQLESQWSVFLAFFKAYSAETNIWKLLSFDIEHPDKAKNISAEMELEENIQTQITPTFDHEENEKIYANDPFTSQPYEIESSKTSLGQFQLVGLVIKDNVRFAFLKRSDQKFVGLKIGEKVFELPWKILLIDDQQVTFQHITSGEKSTKSLTSQAT